MPKLLFWVVFRQSMDKGSPKKHRTGNVTLLFSRAFYFITFFYHDCINFIMNILSHILYHNILSQLFITNFITFLSCFITFYHEFYHKLYHEFYNVLGFIMYFTRITRGARPALPVIVFRSRWVIRHRSYSPNQSKNVPNSSEPTCQFQKFWVRGCCLTQIFKIFRL